MKKAKLLILSTALLFSGLTLSTLASCDRTGPVVKDEVKVSIEKPAKDTLEVGEDLTLKAIVTRKEEYTVLWESSNKDVLSVTQQGKIIALKEGTSEITASVDNKTSEPIKINVVAKKVSSIILKTPSKTTLEAGESVTIETELKNVSSDQLTWTSSDETIIKVDSGKVEALKEGTASVKASYKDVVSNEINFTVVPLEELSVKINSPEKTSLLTNETIKLTAEVKGNKENLPIVWKSLNEDIATIDNEGNVKPLKEGSASFTASVGEVTSEAVTIEILKSYSPVESISYSESKITLALGERLLIKPTILPTSAKQEFTITTSNEIYVSVEGKEIVGKAVSGENKVTVTLKAEEKTFAIEVNVIDASKKYVPIIKEKLNASNVLEETLAKDGHYDEETLDKNGKQTKVDNYSFTIFSDNVISSTHEGGSSYDPDRTTYSLLDNQLIRVNEDKNEDGSYEIQTYGGVSTYSVGSATSDDLTQEEAKKAVNLPFVGLDNHNGKGGVSYKVVYEMFGSQGMTETRTYDNFEMSIKDNVYSIKSSYKTNSSAYDYDVSFTFNEKGLLTTASGSIKNYKLEEDWDTGATMKVLNNTENVDILVNSGERVPSSNVPNASTMFATNFDPIFTTGYGSSKKEGTVFYVGDSVTVDLKNVVPSTYNKTVDPIQILKYSDETAVTTSSWNKISFTAKKAIDSLVITVGTKNVTKEVTIQIKETPLTSLSLNSKSPTKGVVGKALALEYAYKPTNAVADLKAEIVSENASDVTVTRDETKTNKFNFTASKVGTYTLKVTDTKTNVSTSNDITIYPNTDQGIMDLVFSYKNLKSQETRPVITALKLTRDANANSGAISFHASYEDDESYESFEEDFSQKWTFTNGKFVVESIDRGKKITSMAFSSYYSGYAHIEVKLDFEAGSSTRFTIALS